MLSGLEDSADPAEPAPEPAPEPTLEPAPALQPQPSFVPAERRDRPWQPWLIAGSGLALGLMMAAAIAWALWPDDIEQLTQDDITAAVDKALAAQSPATAAGATAFGQISPSMVTVRALSDDSNDPANPASNLGSGVVINNAGQILTANHVIADADSIEVTFADGTTIVAVVDTNDVTLDIAVLKTNASSAVAVPAVMGNPRTLQVGDEIFTVGNPLGLTATLSAGVISGLHRDIPFPGEADLILEDLIQFDAAVNQGSSGGPLLNAEGHVIGIITALADQDGQGGFLGIGFAVPIDLAARGS